MKAMTVKYQSKIDRDLFLEKNWNLLLKAIKENFDYYNNKYRKGLRKTLLTMAGTLGVIFGIVWFNRDRMGTEDMLLLLGGWVLIFFMGFLVEIIDFPYNAKMARKCNEESNKFYDIDIRNICNKETKELVDLFAKRTVYEHHDYHKVEQLLYDLYVFEQIRECKIMDYEDNNNGYVKTIEYYDEDGVVHKIKTFAEICKSVNLSDGNYLIQMTENGLKFVKPL